MVDVIPIIIAVIAAIVAIAALVLVFVIPGPGGPTGPTGTSDLSGFTKVVANGVGYSSAVVPNTANFTAGIPLTVKIPYTNPTLLYNIVYTNGIFTLASGATGYYDIYTENAVSVSLATSPTGNVTLSMDIMVNETSVARSQSRLFFDASNETGVVMLTVGWQGNLKPGDQISTNLTINSQWNGTVTYNYSNMSRLMINGISVFVNA